MKNKISIAFPKGRLLKESKDFFEKIGIFVKEPENRKLYCEDNNFKYVYSRVSDIPIYVENGIDIGICGNDIVKEKNSDILIPLELPFGKCRMSLIIKKEKKFFPEEMQGFKIATKFPNITENFFNSLGIKIKTLKLNGTIELSAKLNIADAIVDIVDTGKTLYENDLKEIAEIEKINSVLVINKISYKLKHDEINKIIKKMEMII
jgi:ATP phosphoribosyltransferase